MSENMAVVKAGQLALYYRSLYLKEYVPGSLEASRLMGTKSFQTLMRGSKKNNRKGKQ